VYEDAFRAAMNRNPTDEEGPYENGYALQENGIDRCKAGHEKLKERQKETCVADLRGDRETCKSDRTD
jgi:hypothetical protein